MCLTCKRMGAFGDLSKDTIYRLEVVGVCGISQSVSQCSRCCDDVICRIMRPTQGFDGGLLRSFQTMPLMASRHWLTNSQIGENTYLLKYLSRCLYLQCR
jgi:hypothetical protein